jgi:hypothetical protein
LSHHRFDGRGSVLPVVERTASLELETRLAKLGMMRSQTARSAPLAKKHWARCEPMLEGLASVCEESVRVLAIPVAITEVDRGRVEERDAAHVSKAPELAACQRKSQ